MTTEAKTLVTLRHPHVLKVLDKPFIDTSRIAIVVERIEGSLVTLFQDIFTLTGDRHDPNPEFEDIFDEEEVKSNIKGLLSSLKFINKDLKKSHYGLSPENIFLLEGSRKWRLGGFGFMTEFGTQIQEIDFGRRPAKPNLYFVSPEHFERVNSRTDLFSCGLLLLKFFVYARHVEKGKHIDRELYRCIFG